jgi:hypothetical protein
MEAFVSEYDIGDSIDSVENAIKKHSSVYDQFCNHSDRIDELRSFEAIFSESASDPEADRIKTKYDELLKRHETVLKECESKTRYLQEARKLQLFLRDCNDVIMWMNTKLQLAYDDEYIDLTHLRSKLKKHRAFDTELQVRRS